MKNLLLLLLLSLNFWSGDSQAVGFLSAGSTNLRNFGADNTPQDFLYSVPNSLPPDGRLLREMSYASINGRDSAGPVSASSVARVNIDLTQGSFKLSASSSAITYTPGSNIGSMGQSVRFHYIDTLQITVAGAKPTDVNFLQLSLLINGTASFENADSVDRLETTLALGNGFSGLASATLTKTCYGRPGRGCDITPKTSFANGSFAQVVSTNGFDINESLSVKIPVTGASASFQLTLDQTLLTSMSVLDLSHTSMLVMTIPTAMIVAGTNGYLLSSPA